jgi:hypothetical protein
MALNFGKLDFAVAFDRLTAFPLDAKSYFESYESATAAAAQAEAAGSSKTTYYFGQTIAVVESGVATLYIIQPNKTLKQVGAEVILDEKIFIKKEDGTISLKAFADAVAGAQLTKGEDGSIKWVKPDTTTVEGLSTAVKSLQDTVGDSTKGLVKDVTDLKTSVGAATDAAKADGSVYARIKQNAADISTLESKMTAVFHFKGAAPGGQLSNVTEKEVGDVYTVGSKEYVWDGTNWAELGDTVSLDGYATEEFVNNSIETATTEIKSYADGLVDDKSAIGKRVTAAEGKITTAEGDIDALEAKLAGIDSTVTAYVEDKEATINAAIKKNTEAIATLNGDVNTAGSVDSKIKAAKTDINTALEGKADKATTLAGYNISDAYTQTQIDNKLKAKQDTITFDGTYGAANPAATVSTVTSAISGIKGTAEDGKDAETIAGAKAYGKDAAATAEKNAKAYADGLVGDSSAIAGRVTVLEGKVDVDKVSTAISTADDAVKKALIGTATDIADKDTIKGAKAYADGKFDTLDGTVSGLATKVNNNAAAITTLNGDATTTGSVAKAVADAKTELNTEIGKKQDKITKETTLAVQTLTTESSGITINPHVEGNDSISIEDDGSNTLHLKKGTYGKAVEITNVATPTGNSSAANKKYVDDTITNATKGLTGAMHYIGASSTDPMLPAGPTVTGHTGAFASGDVVTWGDNKEYVYDGTTWRVLGDEGSYIVKGTKFTDADIADDAAISQLKIDGLQTALAAKLNSTEAESLYVPKKTGFSLVDDAEITKLGTVEVNAQANKIESIKAGGTALTITDKSVNIPAASASAFGVIKVDDTSIKSTGGTIAIKAVSTDLLTQGTQTLILNCGGAAD